MGDHGTIPAGIQELIAELQMSQGQSLQLPTLTAQDLIKPP